MITKQLIERIFSAANILRWNDHIRPFDFFEIDKQQNSMKKKTRKSIGLNLLKAEYLNSFTEPCLPI